jgi:hypothetical protein
VSGEIETVCNDPASASFSEARQEPESSQPAPVCENKKRNCDAVSGFLLPEAILSIFKISWPFLKNKFNAFQIFRKNFEAASFYGQFLIFPSKCPKTHSACVL